MPTTDLSLAADTSGPALVFPFAGVDLTGHALELLLYPGGADTPLSCAGGDLTLAVTYAGGIPTSRVTWSYSRDLTNALPVGRRTLYDLFATLTERRKLVGGAITVDGRGHLSLAGIRAIEVPGLPGLPGWSPVTASVPDGERRVHRITDWIIYPAGVKPPTGQYEGPGGYVDDIADATDIRGGSGAANPETLEARDQAVAAAATVTEAQIEIAADRAAVDAVLSTLVAAPLTVDASTYLVSASDLGRVLRFTGSCVVTLPATLPAGFYLIWRQITTGVTWVPEAGATLRTYPDGTRISGPYASVVASVDTNVGGAAAAWIIEGAIS